MSWASDMAALSPTGWWRLGEASGAFADSGSGSHASSSVGSGVLRGATGLVTGDSDKAVTLDGSANAWIDFGDVNDLDGGSYTVMLAFKLDGVNASNYRRLLNKYNAGVTDGIEIGLMKSTDSPANAIYFDHKVSSTTKEALSAALASGTKYLAFCVYDASADTMKVYVNGAQSGSTVTGVTSDLANNTGSLILGNNQGKLLAAAFGGTLDEVAVWKGTALSSTQIANLYLAFDPPADQNVAAGLASETDTGRTITPDLSPVLTASGSFLSVALGADEYGRAILKATEAATSTGVAGVIRSTDGGANWTDITAHCTVHASGGSYLIADNRPDKGTYPVSAGGSAQYRVKLSTSGADTSYSNAVTVSAIGLTRATVEQDYAQALKTYLDTSANANAEADGAYPGVILTALAYAKAAGYAPSSGDYLTVCSTFWSLIKSRGNINADYLHTPATYSGSTGIRRDFHFRLILHLLVSARLLRQLGGSTANALAADMEDYANRMGKAAFDHLNPTTCTDTSTGDTFQTAWASGSFAAGEIRKPTTPNGHYYRAQNAGSNTTEPTWPTTQGATVTHQGVTWKECSYTASTFAQTYADATYFNTGGYSWDGNQNSEIAAALLLLRSLNTSDFYPGGSYATTGYNHAIGELNLCSVMQYKNGEIPVTATGPHDTHYGSFQLHTTAIALHLLGSGVVTQSDLWLTRALAWFTNTYSSEPGVSNATANGTGGGFATYHRLAEPVWRAAGYEVAGVADPLDGLYYRSSYLQGTDTIYTEWGYTPENAAYPYAYFFEALADYMAVISRQDVPVGIADETDTGLAATPASSASVAVDIAGETDTGRDITPNTGAAPQSVAAGNAGETDTALAMTPVADTPVTVGQGTETDTGLDVTPSSGAAPQSVTTGVGDETDTAFAVTASGGASPQTQAVGLASETDTGRSISASGSIKARIVRETYVTSDQFGSKTVESDTFGERTTYIHPESTIS